MRTDVRTDGHDEANNRYSLFRTHTCAPRYAVYQSRSAVCAHLKMFHSSLSEFRKPIQAFSVVFNSSLFRQMLAMLPK